MKGHSVFRPRPRAWTTVDGQLGYSLPLCSAVWVLRTPTCFRQVKGSTMRRWDSGSRASASGWKDWTQSFWEGQAEEATSPFKGFQSLRLWFTQVSCITLWTPQIISLPLWGFSRVGICLSHYSLPGQVLEHNRHSVNNGGRVDHPKSCSLSGSQELWGLDTTPHPAPSCVPGKYKDFGVAS